jgi:mono/diheme cytochrome c family protein
MSHRPSLILGLALASLTVAAPAGAADFSTYSGAELYHRFCASCHGAALGGDGPVSKTFTIQVPDLTRIAARHGGQFPENWVFGVIDGREGMMAHGPRDMPVWGMELWREQGADITAGAKTRDAISRLVEFLREHQAAPHPFEPAQR